jgi:hypothetical protein
MGPEAGRLGLREDLLETAGGGAGIEGNKDEARFERGEQAEDESDAIRVKEHDPFAWMQTCGQEKGGQPIALLVQLAVEHPSLAGDNGNLFGAGLGHMAEPVMHKAGRTKYLHRFFPLYIISGAGTARIWFKMHNYM